MTDQPLFFDYSEAARRLAVKQSWLEAAVQARRIPHHRLGRLVRFSESDLEQILALTAQAAARPRVVKPPRSA